MRMSLEHQIIDSEERYEHRLVLQTENGPITGEWAGELEVATVTLGGLGWLAALGNGTNPSFTPGLVYSFNVHPNDELGIPVRVVHWTEELK